MQNNERTNVPTIVFGEHKLTYLAGTSGKSKKHKNFTLFVKNEGTFENEVFPETFLEFLRQATPFVNLHFKNKTSINQFIKMLEHFRDEEYGKTQEEIEHGE